MKRKKTIYRSKQNKYSNKKVTVDGRQFDSQKEARRYCELSLLQKAGEIHDLKLQVAFELIPTQREPDIIGKRGGVTKGKTIEKAVTYIADFVYTDTASGKTIVEDTNSRIHYQTKTYALYAWHKDSRNLIFKSHCARKGFPERSARRRAPAGFSWRSSGTFGNG